MSAGTEMSWPAEAAAPKMPRTRPRRSANQRLATVAPRTGATMPVPTPLRTPPEQVQLPELGHRGAGESTAADEGEPKERYPRRAEAVHQPPGHGTGEPVEKETCRDGEGDRRPASPQFRFERVDQDRRRSPYSRRCQKRQKYDRDNGPSIIEQAAEHLVQGLSFLNGLSFIAVASFVWSASPDPRHPAG